MEWSHLRVFLALARQGSVRAAGAELTLGHATVARHLARLERDLGVKLFDRSTRGLRLSAAGETLRASAERVEEEVTAVERRLAGQAQALGGTIRVAVLDIIAGELLMDDFAAFCARYPAIDLELVTGYGLADLDRREADVALRLTAAPDARLLGRKLGEIASAAYASRAYLATHDLADPASAAWIGIGDAERQPAWVRRSGLAHLATRGAIESLQLQLAATRQGLGIGFLPCFVGDRDPDLVRVDDKANYPVYALWLLRHADSRDSARLRAFAEFIAAAVAAKGTRLVGA